VLAPGPGHSPRDRSLAIKLDPTVRNQAGNFLIWRELVWLRKDKPYKITRDQWMWSDGKRDAIETCQRRRNRQEAMTAP
jgi:hypothetical protein